MRKSRKADFEKLAVWGLGAFVLYRMYRENTPLVGQTNDTGNFKNITKETDYVQIRNIVLNEMGKDIFNAANLIAIDARYANQSWQADGNGKNGGISCDGFVALAMHEANLDGPKNDSNTIPDTTYVSTSGYSKSGLYYKVTDSKIGDVVVIRVGLNGSNKATHSHAAILGNIELKRMKNGNVIAVRKTLQSSGGDQTINMGNEFPSGYLKKLHSQDWETKVYYRRKVTQEYFKSKMGNIEYLKEFFERFKKEYSDITFDPKEWIKNKDGDVVRKI